MDNKGYFQDFFKSLKIGQRFEAQIGYPVNREVHQLKKISPRMAIIDSGWKKGLKIKVKSDVFCTIGTEHQKDPD